MTADEQDSTPNVLPIGKLPTRRLGFGSMQLTGHGHWGPSDSPEQAMQIFRDAVDAGVTHIDTADAYGPLTAEKYIRKALHPYPDAKPCRVPGWSPHCGSLSSRFPRVAPKSVP